MNRETVTAAVDDAFLLDDAPLRIDSRAFALENATF